MTKKRMAQIAAPGICATPLGYAINANPGPGTNEIHSSKIEGKILKLLNQEKGLRMKMKVT